MALPLGTPQGHERERVEDEQDLRRERIETFARLLVSAYGFEGYEAEREREQIVRALDENRDPLDYLDLRQRARRSLESSELRRVLVEAGLPDREFEAVLRKIAMTISSHSQNESAITAEPGSRSDGAPLAQVVRSVAPLL
jgi:hypothetical protein